MRSSAIFLALLQVLLLSCGGQETTISLALPERIEWSETHTEFLKDIDGRPVEPLAQLDVPAIVLLFVRCDCPISNRYSPEIARLSTEFEALGVPIWLVYSDEDEDAATVRQHQEEYSLPERVVIDPRQLLARASGVHVTPEAFVARPNGEGGWRPVYRGRIDDQFVSFGRERTVLTSRDLRDALSSVLAGEAVAQPITKAIGCYLSEPSE